MSNELSIRPAAPTDRDTLAAYNVAMAAETEHRRLDPAAVRRGVERVLAEPARGFYLVAEVEGIVVGQLLVTYEWSDWRDGDFWWIQSVYVAPEQRGRGVFRALHAEVERRARAAGHVCGLRLYVDRDNGRAQEVYRALGLTATDYVLMECDWTATQDRAAT